MEKTITQISKELNISRSYLSEILTGKKGCSKELKNKLKLYYPNLQFYIFTKPRYKIISNKKN